MNLVIIGHKGQLGHDLIQIARSFNYQVNGIDLPECDITRIESINDALTHATPASVVINTAAYTAVDKAESDVDAAFAVNRDGAGNVARVCHQKDLPLIHISTDYVFNGLKTSGYKPDDSVGPFSVYGRSKAEGEDIIRKLAMRHVIVRTAWLFGLNGPNFVKTIIRLAKEREVIEVVDDQIGCPTYTADLASALLKVAAMAAQGKHIWGTYHFCNEGAVTWYAFARRIVALIRTRERLSVKEILPVLSSQFPQAARRPQCSILDCTSFERSFNVLRRPWVAALKEMIANLYGTQKPADI